jgi:hypothetical protein
VGAYSSKLRESVEMTLRPDPQHRNQTIGVRAVLDRDLYTLKRDFLLVDQIAVANLHWYSGRGRSEHFRGELDWLIDHELIYPHVSSRFPPIPGTVEDKLPVQIDGIELMPEQKRDEIKKLMQELREAASEALSPASPSARPIFDLLARLFAMDLRDAGRDAVAILDAPVLTRKEIGMKMGEVMQIVIKEMPQPDDSTPWEDIVEFRRDPESSRKLLGLNRWIHQFTSSKSSIREIQEELVWLLQEYEDHMRLHRMKLTKGSFETVLTTTGKVIEDLTRLRFGELAKLPFVLADRKIALLEAERGAPGRDVAYIWKARDTFG